METKTQTTEQQQLDAIRQQVVDRILSKHPQLDANDERGLIQAVYDDYDENDVLHEIYDELVVKMETASSQNAANEADYSRNLDETIALVEQMKEEGNGDAVEQAVAWLQRVGDEVAHGRLLADDIRMVMKGCAYDADVAAAAHEGEVRGRNYVIEERLRTDNAPADVPALQTSGGVTSSALHPQVLGALASTARPTIWERGKEKRY